MRKLVAALAVAILLSCSSSNNDKKLPDASSTNLLLSDYVGIMGNWNMCASYDGETITQRNVCPTIIFNSNGTGQVRLSSQEPEGFSWTLKNNKLQIINKHNSPDRFFFDTTFTISFNKEKNSMNLTVVPSKKILSLSKIY